MPRNTPTNKLTVAAISNFRPGEKPVKLSDGEGMYLQCNPDGSKWWRFAYRFDGKQKLLSLGTFPDVGLKDARLKRAEMRRLLAEGVDPGEHRKVTNTLADRVTNNFEAVAREWFLKHKPNWAESHSGKIIARLERDVFPWLGKRPIKDIAAQEVLACLQRIEARGVLETAHRAMQDCSQIFRYAVATGRATHDPVAALKGALPPAKGGHFAAITDPKGVGQLLRAIDGYQGFLVVRCALKLLPLVFVRPGELRLAQWTEFDLEKGEWHIPGERMKSKQPHMVPLAAQTIKILQELHPLTGSCPYVFISSRNQSTPISNMAFSMALKSIGYSGQEQTAHGFRAIARTLLDEVLGFKVDLIEHQLAHAVHDPLGRAYNRTTHLPERKRMMQAWADYLDQLRTTTGK